MRAAAAAAGVAVRRIGWIEAGTALRLQDRQGGAAGTAPLGFDHFTD